MTSLPVSFSTTLVSSRSTNTTLAAALARILPSFCCVRSLKPCCADATAAWLRTMLRAAEQVSGFRFQTSGMGVYIPQMQGLYGLL